MNQSNIETRPFNSMQRRNQELSHKLLEAHAAIISRDAEIERLRKDNHDQANRITELQFKLDLYDDDDDKFSAAVARVWDLIRRRKAAATGATND